MEAEFKSQVMKWAKKNPSIASEFIEKHLPKILASPYEYGDKLKTKIPLYSYHFHRKPEYRAIYGVSDSKVIFYIIATRETVYKDLKNLL